VRKLVCVAAVMFVLGTLAAAQVPTSGNVFFGYSYYNTDLSSIDRANTNGWEASLEGKVLPFIGIVADFSNHYGSQNFPIPCPVIPEPCPAFSANVTERNILFGPRVSVSVGKIRPFAEALVGVGHVNANAAGTDTSLATALGGGIDYRLIRLVSWRLQGDYVHTRFFGTHQNNIRLSTGIAIHF
jgi:opacity protein-like surface antigen